MENFFLHSGFALTIITFAVGALGSLLLRGEGILNRWAHTVASLGSVFGIITAVIILRTGAWFDWQYVFPAFEKFALHVRIDGLSAFFMLTVSLIAFASSVYGAGYMKKFIGKYRLSGFGFFYNIFIASLILVVTSYHSIHFLAAWELMSITSYFLVIFEHRKKKNIAAGTFYLIMTHVGTMMILMSLLLLSAYTGSFDFEAISALSFLLPKVTLTAVFIFALVGFGIKAGMIPLHGWLPQAHPAAPTHVSALMSGVMIKTAIFMLIRFFFDLLPHTQNWWGIVVMIAGAVSALLGVLYALGQHDIKRLLAYHSVENIGIILIGLGSAMSFAAQGWSTLAILGLVAALYHTINHAVFKTLLFLGAGSVIAQTHTHNMEEHGGLIKKMPYTAVAFLIGAIAISALPPLNGFVSEWLTFQSLFAGLAGSSMGAKVFFVVSIGALAASSGLAAACFVKAFGSTFLAKPRSRAAAEAKEVNGAMRFGMLLLVGVCFVLGIMAAGASDIIQQIAKNLPGFSQKTSSRFVTENDTLQKAEGNIEVFGSLSATTQQAVGESGSATAVLAVPSLMLGLAIILGLTGILVYALSRKQKEIRARTWGCGNELNPRMEITSTSFARSLIMMFAGILRPTKQSEIEYHDENMRYFVKSHAVTLSLHDIYDTYLYKPLYKTFTFLSFWVKKLQSGNVNAYLLYIFITFIALLLWALR